MENGGNARVFFLARAGRGVEESIVREVRSFSEVLMAATHSGEIPVVKTLYAYIGAEEITKRNSCSRLCLSVNYEHI